MQKDIILKKQDSLIELFKKIKLKNNNMDKQFNDLKDKYQKAVKDNNESLKFELLEQMRNNILKRNGGDDCFTRILDSKSYLISKSSYEELLEIDGEKNRITTSQKLTNISDQERKTQTNNNNNPYHKD